MNAIINLNKPKGITSQQAVTKVKRILGARKAGHTGTLDPMATGVLLVCIDEATKISRFLLDKDKTYHASMKLGIKTDTGDAEGRITETAPVPVVSPDEVAQVLQRFKGRISQRPPMYSAVKIDGSPLYKLARRGIEIERPERTIEIHDITIISLDLPHLEIAVSCSKGTYIRTLCEDIGLRLNTLAHLTGLIRTGIGGFSIDQSATLDDLQSGISHGCPFVYSMDDALAGMPEIFLDDTDCRRARNGVKICRDTASDMPDNSTVRLKNLDGELLGLGITRHSEIAIERILNL